MKYFKNKLNTFLSVTSIFMLLSVFPAISNGANLENGKKIYNRYCMECHHTDGKGILAPPFVESTRFKSMDGVAALIDYTMPGETPELCTGTNAEDAAVYIVDEFKFQVEKDMIDPEKIDDEAGRKALFEQNCSVCHGVDGKGDLARPIVKSTLFKTRKDVIRFVDGLMPFHNPFKCKDICASHAAEYIIDNFEIKLWGRK